MNVGEIMHNSFSFTSKSPKGNVFSKIIPSFFVDKASCTRQFESELSLHSLASLFPIKEGSTSHLGLLSSGEKKETALLGARNRYVLRLADHQRYTPDFTGWDRMGMTTITSRNASYIIGYNKV